jgi:hypothetical protein
VGHIKNGDFEQTSPGPGTGFALRWTHIVPVGSHVLFYRAVGGIYAVGHIKNGDFEQTSPGPGTGFALGWTHIVPIGDLVTFYMVGYRLVPSPAEDCPTLEASSTSWVGLNEGWSNFGIIDSEATTLGFLGVRKLFRPANQYELAYTIREYVEYDNKTARALGSGWDFSQAVLPQETPMSFGDDDPNVRKEFSISFGGDDPNLIAALRRTYTEEAVRHYVSYTYSDNFGYAIDTTGLNQSLQESLENILADGQDSAQFFFVEAGMTIDYLNTLLNSENPPRALRTMGGATAQTIAGAFSTGTHGGDFDRPPLADAVRAIYLVGAGGVHHWIEPATPITDETKLRKTFPCLYGTVHYDDDLFRSVLVSFGAMGVIYAVILDVVPQYSLQHGSSLSAMRKKLIPLIISSTVFGRECAGT